MNSITTLELQENPQAYLTSLFSNCNLVKLQLLDGTTRELAYPKLGRDLLAGTLEDGKAFGVFRKSTLRSVEFANQPELSSDRLEYTRRAIGELLSAKQFPALARIAYLESQASKQRVQLLGVTKGFLITNYFGNPAVPIAALGSIELEL